MRCISCCCLFTANYNTLHCKSSVIPLGWVRRTEHILTHWLFNPSKSPPCCEVYRVPDGFVGPSLGNLRRWNWTYDSLKVNYTVGVSIFRWWHSNCLTASCRQRAGHLEYRIREWEEDLCQFSVTGQNLRLALTSVSAQTKAQGTNLKGTLSTLLV